MSRDGPEELEIEASEGMIEELRKGWKQLIEINGMKNLTFHRYLSACVMYGHWNIHKCSGLLVIMMEESERAGRQREGKE